MRKFQFKLSSPASTTMMSSHTLQVCDECAFIYSMSIGSNIYAQCFLLIVGLLQIQFLSSAIGFAIQQHCQHVRDGYDTLLLPQFSQAPSSLPIATIHFMWVQLPDAYKMNHIIPLLLTTNCMLVLLFRYYIECLHAI